MGSAIYLRKSRAEEETEDALKRHREILLDYAKKNELFVIKIYEEVVSGENLYMRPKMLQLLLDVEQRKYDSVLCMDIDRLGRGNMSSQGLILETFKTANCKIITPRRIYDLNNELDEEYTEFETFMARREYKIITRRMRRGIIKSVESGGHIGEVPFGYKRAFNGKLPTLAIDEETAPFIRMAFDMYVNQGLGCHVIANTFTSIGLSPKRNDGSWSRTTIRKIIKNPVYTGEICWNKYKNQKKKNEMDTNKQVLNNKNEWIIVKNAHPAIIDRSIFDRAQAIMMSRSHSSYFTGEFQNPLAGLVYCSKCGKLMQRQYQSKRDHYPRLFCRTKGCSKGIRLEFVEKAVLYSLKETFSDMELKIKKSSKCDTTFTFQSFHSELSKLQFQRNRLHDLLEQGIYSVETYNERLYALSSREKSISDTLYSLQSEKNNIDHKVIADKITYLTDHYFLTDNPKQKNMLLKAIIQKIVYTRNKDFPERTFDISLELKGF